MQKHPGGWLAGMLAAAVLMLIVFFHLNIDKE
jgi:hypothetical protein